MGGWMKKLTVLLALGAVAVLVLAAPASAQPRIKIECGVYGPNRIDPIVSGSGHLHHHFGNTTTTNRSTGKSLKAAGSGAITCDKRWFTSAAWFPVERFAEYTLESIDAYYRAPGDQKQVKDIPTGLEIIAKHPKYHCESWSTGRFEDTPPYSCKGRWNTQLQFPDCWDRESLKWADAAHMRYSNRTGVCPQGYGYLIPALTYKINHRAGIPNPLTVSAGIGTWEDYTFTHADYLAANHDVFDNKLIDLCLRNAPDSVTVADPRCGLEEGR